MEALIKNVFEQLELVNTVAEVARLYELNQKNIDRVNKLIKKCAGTIGEKKHLENALLQLKTCQALLRKKFKTGEGLQNQPEELIEWQQVRSKHRLK